MAYALGMTPEQELEHLRLWPEEQVCGYLAMRVRRARTETGETQAAFAARALVPLRTYKRFEKDGSATLQTFVQILRTLGRTQYLMHLFPQPLPAPSAHAISDRLRRLRAGALLDEVRASTEPISQITARLVEGGGG